MIIFSQNIIMSAVFEIECMVILGVNDQNYLAWGMYQELNNFIWMDDLNRMMSALTIRQLQMNELEGVDIIFEVLLCVVVRKNNS